MSTKVINKFFSYARRIFFDEISPKFRAESLKKLMDILYVIFEKIGFKFNVISYNYLKLYNELVEKEIAMANISSEDLILVIGCGSLPATPALIAMKTKARVVSIDKDYRAIGEAFKFIKSLNLQDMIKLEHADGLYFAVENFDVIFLLYGVTRQREILEYLSNSINDKARIIFRTTTDLEGRIQGGRIDLSNLFEIKNHIKSEILGQTDSFLLYKKISK